MATNSSLSGTQPGPVSRESAELPDQPQQEMKNDCVLCCRGYTVSNDGFPAIPYRAIILVEPSIATKEAYLENQEERQMAVDFMIKSLSTRRAFWAGREEARAFFAKRIPWQLWDPRVLDLWVVGLFDSSSL